MNKPCIKYRVFGIVRQEGIEPSTPAWQAGILPLNYCRLVEMGESRTPRSAQTQYEYSTSVASI